MKIYMDYNATTPMAPEVIDIVTKSLKNDWANPSSCHELGINAKSIIDKARKHVSDLINCESGEILFTSGGTESNNMVLQSICQKTQTNYIPHIITCTIEHPSIIEPLKYFQEKGLADVSFVKPRNFYVDVNDILNEIRPNTKLITIMLANNETGAIQPIQDICNIVKEKNSNILFHTDASQMLGKCSVNVKELGVDYLTITGHKFYGPRIGAIYAKNGMIKPLLFGGNQEFNKRPGTENVSMIAGLGEAARLVSFNLPAYESHMLNLRKILEKRLLDYDKNIVINCDGPKLPNTSNVSFLGFDGCEILKFSNVMASIGAACHNDAPSKILLECGLSKESAIGAIRLSVGRETTIDEVEFAVTNLIDTYKQL